MMAGSVIGEGISAESDLQRRDALRAQALRELNWPSPTTSPVRLVVPAGSVILTPFDLFHRGTRREKLALSRSRRQKSALFPGLLTNDLEFTVGTDSIYEECQDFSLSGAKIFLNVAIEERTKFGNKVNSGSVHTLN